jgi:hypothetical protein
VVRGRGELEGCVRCPPSWFLDGEANLALLDEELVEALQDETARAILREVVRLPDRERRIGLGIVRRFQDMGG